MTDRAWIIAGAVAVLMFGAGLMCGHRVATAHARHARADASACVATLHRAGASMARMTASVREVNSQVRALTGRNVITINGVELEVR
jgi:hypothetical protein